MYRPVVTDFLSQPGHLLIDGDFVAAASGKRLPVINPANGQQIAQVAEADAEDVDRAVRAAPLKGPGRPSRRLSARV